MKHFLLIVFSILYSNILVYTQSKLPQELEKQIDELFTAYENQPGVALGIFKQGEIILSKGYGLANLDYNIPITPSTVFETAGLSKQFTAACIYLLEAQGKLSVHDPIQKYLPEMPKYDGQSITIDHLLHHTSGLRGYLRLHYAKGQSLDTDLTNEQILKLLSKQTELNFSPGSQFSYSYSGYVLLANIVQQVSGLSLGDFSKKYIFEPLGMEHTFIHENAANPIKNRAIGYESVGDSYQRYHFFNNEVTGSQGVYTTIEDFFKWSENFKHKKVGGTAFVDKMLKVGKLNNGNDSEYAGGLFLGNYENLFTIGHDGYWTGFRTLFFKFTAADVTFVILSNNANVNVWALRNQLFHLLMQDEIAQANERESLQHSTAAPIASTVDKHILQQYVGDYFNYETGYTRKILLEKDTLIYMRSNTDHGNKLIPIDHHSFYFQGFPDARLSFQVTANQPTKLQVQIGQQAPIELRQISLQQLTASSLAKFEGQYYSKELDVIYDLKVKKEQLCIYIDDQQLACMNPVNEQLFNEVHFGYLQFEKTANGSISKFTINDESAKNIEFVRITDS